MSDRFADVVTVRFGTPHLVPTKTPDYEKGFRVPCFSPQSFILRPAKPAMREQDFLLLSSPEWRWPHDLSVAEGDWGNWQTADNRRWCHIEVHSPSFPNSNQAQVCKMIGVSKRAELSKAEALFVTATHDVCERIVANCAIDPDVRCANGPGGELLGWTFREERTRAADRTAIIHALAPEGTATTLNTEDAISITSRSDEPLVPSPAGECYYPAQLVWQYNELPSPHYLKGRKCVFVEFWKIADDVAPAREKLNAMPTKAPDGWHLWIDCKYGNKTGQTFAMVSLETPWPLESSATELAREIASRVDTVYMGLASLIQNEWPDARCATAEFWEQEVRFPAGVFAATEHGLVRSNWWPEKTEEETISSSKDFVSSRLGV